MVIAFLNVGRVFILQLMLLCHSIRRTGTENREERDTLRKWSGRKEGGKRYTEEVEWEERGRERDTLRKWSGRKEGGKRYAEEVKSKREKGSGVGGRDRNRGEPNPHCFY